MSRSSFLPTRIGPSSTSASATARSSGATRSSWRRALPGRWSRAPRRDGAAAVRLAEALGYVGAGTAEFIVGDEGEFWFLELNARIQVEHPVTELVTGLDLVEQQLRVAAASRSRTVRPGPPDTPSRRGSMPSTRSRSSPRPARSSGSGYPGVRVDAGVEAGDEVPVGYDPLIAKLVAHAETREDALDLLAEALHETEVGGVVTNLAFLRWALRHPIVRAGQVTTAFLDEYPPLSRPAVPRRPWAGGSG